MNTNELYFALEKENFGRGAWCKGVKTIALMIVEHADFFENVTIDNLLNGAQSVRQFVDGGSGLIYYTDVVDTLCNNTEKKYFYDKNGGTRHEDKLWDANKRATFQAFRHIADILGEHSRKLLTI